jgi:HPt (histidine-containing phosphotransfer) domain-containing protein
MKYLCCAALAVTLYSLGCFLEKISPTLEAALIAYRIQSCAGPCIGTFIALFSLDYTGKPVHRLSRDLVLYTIPLCISILALIDPRNLAGNFRFVSGERGGYLDITQFKVPYTTMVHALKGISRSIGAADIGEMAARLEEAGRAGDRLTVTEKTGEFLSALETLTDRIAAALNESAAPKTEGTASLSAAQIGELRGALLKMDTEKVNRLLSECASLPLEKALKELINEIEQDVLLFEYESAIAKLEKLLSS